MLWVTLPVFYGSPPVGVYVVGSRPRSFAELGGGGRISAAASAAGVCRPPSAGRGTLQAFVCWLFYRLRRFPRQRVSSISARVPATSIRSSPFVSVRVRSGRLFAQRRLAVASACPFRVCWRCISGKKSVKSRKKVETRLEKFSVGDILDDVLRLMTPFLRSERFARLIKVLEKIRRFRLTSLKTMIY